MEMIVTYLDHSGFLLELEDKYILFDYSNMTPAAGKQGLAAGVIDPSELQDKPVYIFVSHHHGDHFIPEIFEWRGQLPHAEYILSFDIQPQGEVLRAQANASYTIDDISFHTYLSTDEGVAFLLRTNGATIYHAGDLNWWHWEGEPSPWNEDMETAYKKQIDLLTDTSIDLAFVPVDPRLGDELLWGLEYLAQQTDTKQIIPMHFWNQPAAVTDALPGADTGSRTPVLHPPMQRGEQKTIIY